VNTPSNVDEHDGRLPDAAWWAALASLPLVGPARLTAMHGRWTGEVAWAEVSAGRAHRHEALAPSLGRRPAELSAHWARAAASVSVEEVWERHRASGIGVSVLGGPGYPEALAADPDPPVVVFSTGDLTALRSPAAAVVGTRRATRYGLELAHEMGGGLALAGVQVVSGLALGIDGAAHRGCVAALTGHPSPTGAQTAAPPVAVVGSGLDICYPTANRTLWSQVADAGVVLSEAPLGVRPERWRFPARNRLIAALADVVVVVESPDRGGSLLTADAAAERGIPVLAVPGSVRSRASAGTNRLLLDGAGVARHADDVREVLGLATAGSTRPAGQREPPSQQDLAVLEGLGWQPATLQQLAERTGLDLGHLAVSLGRLVDTRWVAVTDGWFERSNGTSP